VIDDEVVRVAASIGIALFPEHGKTTADLLHRADLAIRKTTGVEGLVRWRHPTRGLLQPASFLPHVEGTALIAPLTRWVLNEALRQQQTWRGEGVDLTMAVNVSARTMHPTGELPDAVAELTEAWGSAPDRLTLELTESTVIEPAAPDVLARLHKMGGKVSIDDFATGYCSRRALLAPGRLA
jgi:predicted signal transduction protein with EAL and GGDEF domain